MRRPKTSIASTVLVVSGILAFSALALAAANRLRAAGAALEAALAILAIFLATRAYIRYRERIWRLIAEHGFVRFLAIFLFGLLLSFGALCTALIPGRLAFAIAAWPVAMMLWWLFPAPCFDRGPGIEPFCEATPIQVIAGAIGLVVLLLFYFSVASVLIRRVLTCRRAG